MKNLANLRKFVFLFLVMLFTITLICCEKEDEKIKISINVFDLDEEMIGSKEIITTENANVLDLLKENFKVESTTSQYGEYLNSVNDSIIDPNYYLAIYENNELTSTGISELKANDGDVFDIKDICWNTEFDEIDILVDKTIYGFMKKYTKEILENSKEYFDYYLTSAIITMNQNGYNAFSFDELDKDKALAIKETLEKKDWTSESVNNLMKGMITLIALDGNLANIKEQVNNIQTYNEWLLVCTKYFDITNEYLTNYVDSLEQSNGGDEYSLMTIVPKQLYKDMGKNSIETAFTKSSENGIDSVYGNDNYGCNSATTALFDMACISQGINPREKKVNDTDMIEALFKYLQDGAFNGI